MMTIIELGRVRASVGRNRKVQWDDRSHEVYVEGKPGFLGGGSMRRIGITTRNRGDVMEFARSWLEDDPAR
jgi:hypothetical protein